MIEDTLKSDSDLVKMYDESWKNMSNLPTEKKDEIGIQYLRHIVGVSERTIGDFIKGKYYADQIVGLRQTNMHKRKEDFAGFWTSVIPLIPQSYTREQIDWLGQNGEFAGVQRFLTHLDSPMMKRSIIMHQILENLSLYSEVKP